MGYKHKTDEERLAAKRASNAASERKRKAAMTPEERVNARAANTESKRKRRADMNRTHERRDRVSTNHKEYQRKRNAVMTPEEQANARAANAESKRKRRAAMTPEERAKARAAHSEFQRKRRAAMTPEQLEKLRAAHSESQRKRRAAMTPEQLAKLRAAHCESQRKRKNVMTPDQRARLRGDNSEQQRRRRAKIPMTEEEAKCRVQHKEELLGVKLTEEESKKMIAEYLEARAKKLTAMTEEERNKSSPSGLKSKYSKMSEEERNKWRAKLSARKHAMMKIREKLDNKATKKRIEKLISLSMDAANSNPERYEIAGTFIKNCLLDIGFLHVELGELKKQLKQTLSEAVENAVKIHRDEKQKTPELQSLRFVEVPLSFEADKTTTFGNLADPLLLKIGEECNPESPISANEDIELQNQNHEIFEVFPHDSTCDNNSKHASTINKLACSICSNKFETSLGLTIHQKNHAVDSNEFSCSICSEVFHTYPLIATHYLQDHSNEFRDSNNENKVGHEEIDDELERCVHEMDFLFSRKCLICFKTLDVKTSVRKTATLANFGKHIIEQHSENKHLLKYFTHICARCGKPHSLLRSLESHWKTICFRRWKDKNKDSNKVVCEQCGSKFSNEQSLSSHNKIFHPAKTNICKQCGSQFKSENRLKWHVIWVHETQYKFTCEYCNRKFKDQKCLKKHKKTVHLGEKPFVCKFCSKRFAGASSLKYHENTHTGEKPYECNVCGKSYSSQSSLIIHRGVHEGFRCKICSESFDNYFDLCTHRKLNHNSRGESDSNGISVSHPNPTSCDICGKSVKGFMSLKCHKRTVHQGKKYMCDICGKGYQTAGALREHKYSHDNFKRFGCNLCGRKFRQSTNFYQHRKVAHINENAQIVKLISEVNLSTGTKAHRLPTISDFKSANDMNHALDSEQSSNAEQEQTSIHMSEVTINSFKNNVPDTVASNTSKFNVENEDSTGLDDYFSEIEFTDDQENDALPQFEISELSNARSEKTIPELVTQDAQNCNNLKECIEKTLADKSPPNSSESNECSRLYVTLGFAEMCDEEPNTQPNKPNSTAENQDAAGNDNQHQVFIEDSEDNAFITDLSIHDFVKLKSEPSGRVIVEEDQDIVSDLFDYNDYGSESENENDIQINREKIKCESMRDSRKQDLKFPRLVSSPHLVVKLTKLFEYNCLLCDKTIFAISQRELRQHSRTHRESIPQKKEKCKLKDKKIGSSQNAEKIRGIYDCLYCDTKELKTTKEIIEHCSKEHPGQDPLKCKVCFKMFKRAKAFFDHKSRGHKKDICKLKKEKCESKKKKIGSSQNGEITKGLYDCLYCDMKEFKTTTTIIEHCSKEHPGLVPLQCKVCLKMFNTAKRFLNHKSQVHNSALDPNAKSEFMCEVCGKNFSTEKNVKWHALRMHQERNFQCDLCPKVFFKMRELQLHKMRHSGMRPHLCEECGKSFFTPHELTDHTQRVHQKIEKRKKKLKEKSNDTHPFSCNMCPYVFKKESGLKLHLKLHDPNRKHSCDECGLRFILRANVITHKDLKHKKNGKRNIKPQ